MIYSNIGLAVSSGEVSTEVFVERVFAETAGASPLQTSDARAELVQRLYLLLQELFLDEVAHMRIAVRSGFFVQVQQGLQYIIRLDGLSTFCGMRVQMLPSICNLIQQNDQCPRAFYSDHPTYRALTGFIGRYFVNKICTFVNNKMR